MVGDLVNQSTEVYMPKNKRKVRNVLTGKPLKLPPKQKNLPEEVLKDREKLNFIKLVDSKGLEVKEQYELPVEKDVLFVDPNTGKKVQPVAVINAKEIQLKREQEAIAE
jgi:hypothetical protein